MFALTDLEICTTGLCATIVLCSRGSVVNWTA
jgi:hypothetical protein